MIFNLLMGLGVGLGMGLASGPDPGVSEDPQVRMARWQAYFAEPSLASQLGSRSAATVIFVTHGDGAQRVYARAALKRAMTEQKLGPVLDERAFLQDEDPRAAALAAGVERVIELDLSEGAWSLRVSPEPVADDVEVPRERHRSIVFSRVRCVCAQLGRGPWRWPVPHQSDGRPISYEDFYRGLDDPQYFEAYAAAMRTRRAMLASGALMIAGGVSGLILSLSDSSAAIDGRYSPAQVAGATLSSASAAAGLALSLTFGLRSPHPFTRSQLTTRYASLADRSPSREAWGLQAGAGGISATLRARF